MALNMAAMTGVNTVLAITPAVFMLWLESWCLIICFLAQRIHMNTYFQNMM